MTSICIFATYQPDVHNKLARHCGTGNKQTHRHDTHTLEWMSGSLINENVHRVNPPLNEHCTTLLTPACKHNRFTHQLSHADITNSATGRRVTAAVRGAPPPAGGAPGTAALGTRGRSRNQTERRRDRTFHDNTSDTRYGSNSETITEANREIEI